MILSQADATKAEKVMQKILKKCTSEGISFSYGILASSEFHDNLKPEEVISAIDKKMYEHSHPRERRD